MKKLIALFVLVGILASCNRSKTNTTSETNQLEKKSMTNKEIVGTFLGAAAQQDDETIRQFANANYIQSNTTSTTQK